MTRGRGTRSKEEAPALDWLGLGLLVKPRCRPGTPDTNAAFNPSRGQRPSLVSGTLVLDQPPS
jgi:hypothetical protein